MEYKLNKIDTDLRQKINDAAREGKVHGAKNIAINKDKQQEEKKNKNCKLKQYNKNDKLIVNAVKTQNVEVNAFKDNIETNEFPKGVYLDVKK
jgi:broad specificity polyphosphatase/5'/3'-nucleotidase SurE